MTRASRLAPIAAILLGATCYVTAAPAQDAPGGVEVGGGVPSYLQLSLVPSSGRVRMLDGGRVRIGVVVTATDAPTDLTVAAIADGRRRGQLVRGDGVLRDSLVVDETGAARSLDAPVDALLRRWEQPITRARATVRLRQRGPGGSPAGRHETVLVTVAPEAP